MRLVQWIEEGEILAEILHRDDLVASEASAGGLIAPGQCFVVDRDWECEAEPVVDGGLGKEEVIIGQSRSAGGTVDSDLVGIEPGWDAELQRSAFF